VNDEGMHKPLDIDYFILDSGAEDWHDLHLNVVGKDPNSGKEAVVGIEVDYLIDGWALVDQLQSLTSQIAKDLIDRGLDR